jgi:hypothetical protein
MDKKVNLNNAGRNSPNGRKVLTMNRRQWTSASVLYRLASKYLRTRNSVRLSFVGVICNAGICGLVRARERHQSSRTLRSTSRDLDLMTARVELRTRVAVGGVQGDDLMTDEVVTGLQAFRDGVGGDSTSLHERRVAPRVRCSLASFLFDFEPHGVAVGHVIVAACGGACRHVRYNGLRACQREE